MWSRSSLAAGLACVAACGQAGPPPPLDPERLPDELMGLVPGVATERDLADVFPDATAVRDEAFGGTHRVQLSGEPAIQVRDTGQVVEAWLVWLDGDARIASFFARLERSCSSVAADLRGHARKGPCNPRELKRNEHPSCAATPDRRYTIDLACFDPPEPGREGWISAHLNFAPARDRWFSIGPAKRLGYFRTE